MAKINSTVFPGWTGGLNKESDPAHLSHEELIEALNVLIGLSGSVERRPGYSSVLSPANPVETMKLWDGVGGDRWYIYVAESSTSTNRVVVARDAPISSTTTFATDWDAHTNKFDYHFGVAALDGKLFITTRRSSAGTRAVYWDGTSWTEVTDYSLNGSGTEFPQAAALVAAHNRMFAFNCEVGAGTFGSRMYYSDADQPLTWQAENWIAFNPDDGQQITGAVAFGESILVFKERSSFVLSGTTEDTFTVFPLDPRVGTEAPGTIVPDGNTLRWFDPYTGVWAFNGRDIDKLDDKINTHLLDGINQDVAYKAHAFMWNQKYCLSVPWGDDTFNSRTFVYDTRLQAWSEWTFGSQATWLDRRTLYVGSPMRSGAASPDDMVGEFDSAFSDGGNEYVSRARTGWLSPTQGALKHRLRRLDASFASPGGDTLDINTYRDYAVDSYNTKSVEISLGGLVWGSGNWGEKKWGGDLDQLFIRLVGWGNRWRWLSIEFYMDGTGTEFTVNKLVMHTSRIGSLREPTDLST